MFKKGSTSWVVWNIFEALIFLVAGILSCAFSGNSDFQNTIILIMGIIVLVEAALRLTLEILVILKAPGGHMVKSGYGTSLVSTAEVAIGVLLIIISQNMADAAALFYNIGIFIGVSLITAGALVVLHAILFLVKKNNTVALNLLAILGGGIVIGLGVLALVFFTEKKNIMQFFLILFGVLLILAAVAEIAVTIAVKRGLNKVEEALEPKPEQPVEEVPVQEAPVEEKPAEETPDVPEEPRE